MRFLISFSDTFSLNQHADFSVLAGAVVRIETPDSTRVDRDDRLI
jgi:hypothetical protein